MQEQRLVRQEQDDKVQKRLNISQNKLDNVKRLEAKMTKMHPDVRSLLHHLMTPHKSRLVDFSNDSLHLLNRLDSTRALRELPVFFGRYDFTNLRVRDEDKMLVRACACAYVSVVAITNAVFRSGKYAHCIFT